MYFFGTRDITGMDLDSRARFDYIILQLFEILLICSLHRSLTCFDSRYSVFWRHMSKNMLHLVELVRVEARH
jgi:hypothetical protein